MGLRVVRRENEANVYELYSGGFRIGTVRALSISDIAPTRYVWVISGVMLGGDGSGSSTSIEGATTALADRWRQWLVHAELEEMRAVAAVEEFAPET